MEIVVAIVVVAGLSFLLWRETRKNRHLSHDLLLTELNRSAAEAQAQTLKKVLTAKEGHLRDLREKLIQEDPVSALDELFGMPKTGGSDPN